MRAHEQQHFDNISQHYQKSAESWQMIYEQAGQQLDPLVRDRLVVDVGNGGRFAYDTSLPARVIAVDVAPQMMVAITDPRIQKIVDDARDLNKFPDGSIDVLVFSLVMHDINGANLAESRATLNQDRAGRYRSESAQSDGLDRSAGWQLPRPNQNPGGGSTVAIRASPRNAPGNGRL